MNTSSNESGTQRRIHDNASVASMRSMSAFRRSFDSPQTAHLPLFALEHHHGRSAARGGLEPERTAAAKGIETAPPTQIGTQPVEERLARDPAWVAGRATG
jgi:hypothetical protein